MFNKRVKSIICSLLVLSAASSLFAVEEYVSNIYKEIDKIFLEKSEELLNEILQNYQEDKNYYLIENYAQKKVRRLILNDEYPFAMSAIIVIIENNLDNEEAIEMYGVISDAVEEQKKQGVLALEKEQNEIARLEQEKEKKRGVVDKEYVSAATVTGKSVYISNSDIKTTNKIWDFNFGMLTFGSLVDTAQDPVLNGLSYGVSLRFDYAYATEDKSIGVDTYGEAKFLNFGEDGSKIPITASVELMPKFAFNNLSKKLFFRFGMMALFTGKSSLEHYSETPTIENFYSPAVGLLFDKIKIGSSTLSIGADYLAGHLMYDDIKFSAAGKVLFTIPFASTEKFNMTLNLGVKDNFFLKEEGIENRASVILAIGAQNVK